jgi:hypothetical protein
MSTIKAVISNAVRDLLRIAISSISVFQGISQLLCPFDMTISFEQIVGKQGRGWGDVNRLKQFLNQNQYQHDFH